MVLVLSIASLALAAISAVSGRVVPRKSSPPGWDCENLEPYNKYHLRYLNFDCQAHHGTQYFDLCCHPRQANETSVPFPSECGCDDDDDDTPSSYSTQMTPTPTPTDVTPTPVTPIPSESPQPDQPSEPSSSTSSTPVTPTPTESPQSDQPSEPSSSTPAPSPTPSPVTDTSQGSSGNNNSNDVHTGGQATFFYQNGAAGACGQVHSDDDLICAMDQDLFGTSGPSSPLCGKQVTITNTANGNTVTVTVADDCPTCSNSNSIDLSRGAFERLGSLDTGVLDITWFYSS